MEIELSNQDGITLKTKGKYCSEDIDITPKLQTKTTTVNGKVTSDNGYVGLKEVTVNVPSKDEETKTVDLNMASGNQTITPTSGKVLSQVVVKKPATMLPENIKKDVNIGGVTGTLEEAKPEQEKPITITTNGSQMVTPDEGKVLSKVTITTNVPATPTEEKTVELALANGNQVLTPTAGKNFSKVTIMKPATLTPENIKKDTNIGGVVGTLEGAKPEQEKTVEATNRRETILPDSGKTLSKVVIKSAPLPASTNYSYRNINECLIAMSTKTLLLGCEDSVIPSNGSVASIGEWAFYNCKGLTSVTIPDSVTSIGEQAFRDCSGLTDITIPNSVTSIGEAAFYGCSGLTSVTIGNGITSISDSAFKNCDGLTSVTIPDSVTSIGDWAFNSCVSLTSITIPNGVTSIGSYAFGSCVSLTSITIPNGVTSIRSYTFLNCYKLTSITIPDGVISIGEGAFVSCIGLTSITIPDSVTSIHYRAFGECSGLTSVVILSTIPPTLTSYAFPSNVTTITVPAGCGDAYKTAEGWSAYADKIVEAAA